MKLVLSICNTEKLMRLRFIKGSTTIDIDLNTERGSIRCQCIGKFHRSGIPVPRRAGDADYGYARSVWFAGVHQHPRCARRRWRSDGCHGGQASAPVTLHLRGPVFHSRAESCLERLAG